MNLRITLEWDEQCGITANRIYSLRDGIEKAFSLKNYGGSISRIGVVMTCMNKDLNQRKRYKKDTKEFIYDILLDYFLIKNKERTQKEEIIQEQIIEITEQTFSKYKFDDFDKAAFLTDLRKAVANIEW